VVLSAAAADLREARFSLPTRRVPAKMCRLLLKSADVLYNAHFWAILHEAMCSFSGCEVLYREVRKETA